MTLSNQLLEILACPQCKGELAYQEEIGLTCARCRITYPVTDGIPVLIVPVEK